MTTFHDPQPLSRRAARQSEREESADSVAASAVPVPAPEPATSSGHAEPLSYATKSGLAHEAPTLRPRSTAGRDHRDDQAAPHTATYPDESASRARDFSPEGRRAAPAAPPSWGTAPAPTAASFDYQTGARVPASVPPVTVVPPTLVTAAAGSPASLVERFEEPRIDQTLTRRELRALQVAEELERNAGSALAGRDAAAFAPPTPPVDRVQPPVQAQPPVQVQLQPPVQSQARPTSVPQGEPHSAPEPWMLPAVEVTLEHPGSSLAVPSAVESLPTQAPSTFPTLAPEPTIGTARTQAMDEFDALTAAPSAYAGREIEDAPPSQWTPPLGHWSVQAGLDDETQPYESTINRTVGSGTYTTNALVLPSIPAGSDIRGPLTRTGEIMLTGSIDLPHGFSSTGATASVQQGDLDALFELHDAEVVSTDSQPVRAVSAVSTHHTGQGVTHTHKPKGTRALTALVIAAASMAVVVVGLLVAVFVLGVF